MKKSGKCSRCGRALKTVFIVDGAEYGPVCVKKMGGVTVAYVGGQPNRRHVETVFPSDQLSFMEILDATLLDGQ